MTLHPDKFDHEQAAAFDAAHAKENEYYRNLINYWVFTWTEQFEADGFEKDTAEFLAKSFLESVITFAHLPIEERREKVDAFERERSAREWARVTKSKETVKG